MLALHPEIASRVKRLTTIATPHYGSPVADQVVQGNFGLPNLRIPVCLTTCAGDD